MSLHADKGRLDGLVMHNFFSLIFLSFLVKGIAKLPFVEERRLLETVALVEKSLTVHPIYVLDIDFCSGFYI